MTSDKQEKDFSGGSMSEAEKLRGALNAVVACSDNRHSNFEEAIEHLLSEHSLSGASEYFVNHPDMGIVLRAAHKHLMSLEEKQSKAAKKAEALHNFEKALATHQALRGYAWVDDATANVIREELMR